MSPTPSSSPRGFLATVKKILFGATTLIGVTILCLSVLFLSLHQAALQRQIELRAEMLAKSIANQSEFALLVGDTNELQHMADFALAGNPDVLYVAVEDADGKTIRATARPPLTRLMLPPSAGGPAAIRRLQIGPKSNIDCTEAGAPVMVRSEPGLFNLHRTHETALGRIRIGVSLAAQHQMFVATEWYIATIAFLIFLVACVVEYFETRQRRALDKLRRIQERLESIVTLSPAALYTATLAKSSLSITFMGNNVKEVLGFCPADFAAPRFFWERIHPDDAARIEVAMAGMAERNQLTNEYRFLHRDGSYRWIQDRLRIVRDASGAVQEVIGSLFDVTEKREAEEALQKSELRYRELTEMLPQTVFECDADAHVTYMNQSGLDALGLSRADLEQGVKTTDLVAPEDRAWILDSAGSRLSADQEGPHEYCMWRKDGSTFPGAIYSTSILSQGKPAGIRGILIDISDRKQAEEALREWAILVQSSNDAIIRASGDRIAFWNAGAEQIFGYRAEEIVGHPLQDIVPPDRHGDIPRVMELLDRGEIVAHFDTQCVRKDGRTIDVSLSMTPVRDAGGRLIGTFSILRDITEIQERQRDLLKQNALLELLQASAVAVNQATTAEDAVRACLACICLHTGWDVGHAYLMPEGAQSTPASTGIWSIEEPARFAEFRAASEKLAVEPGVELLGRVLSSGQPGWVADLATDAGVTRGRLATASGLRTALASPILAGREVVGVLEFFSSATMEAADPFREAVDAIGMQLGRVIERARASRALSESEARYRAITENAVHGVLTINPDGRILYANRTTGAIFGRSIEELPNLDVSQLAPGHARRVQQRWLRRLMRRSDVEFVLPPFEFGGLHSSGQEIPLEISLSGYMAKDNTRVCTVVIRDVSARKQAEEAVQRANQTLVAVVQNSPLAIVTLDLQGTVKSWNAAAESMFGWSSEQVVGRVLPTIPKSADEHCLEGSQRIVTGETIVHEVCRLRKDGTYVEVSGWGAPLRCGSGDIIGMIIEYVDLTERKRLEAQLRQAQKLESIGQLASGLAHEINTPIQYVGDNTLFLEEAFGEFVRLLDAYDPVLAEARNYSGSKKLVESVDDLAKKTDFVFLRQEVPRAIHESMEGVRRVAEIVGAMKNFSHPGENLTSVDLNQAIESTILVCRNEWKYVAELVAELDPGLPRVRCVPGEINQVVLNLIINAAHSIADVTGKSRNGTITVSSRLDGDWVELRVRDTGTGIPPEVRPRVFDPFFTTKEVGKGTGQGLSIAHSVVVQKHAGTIHFETEMGVGTVFIVRLPLNRNEAAA